MRTIFHQPKPRNPLVVLARSRRAGSHRESGGSHRQQAGRALQREIKAMNEKYP